MTEVAHAGGTESVACRATEGRTGMTIFIPVTPAKITLSSRPPSRDLLLLVIPEDTKYLSGISQTVWLRLNSLLRRSPLKSMRG